MPNGQVDDGGLAGGGIGHDVADGKGARVEEGLYDRVLHGFPRVAGGLSILPEWDGTMVGGRVFEASCQAVK